MGDYFRYFLFITRNWDIRLALFVIFYEIWGESKYKLHTTGMEELSRLEEKGVDISHASFYMPVNYFILWKLMHATQKYTHNKTFLDIGCGKGRAMAVAAYYGFEKITGIDFSKDFCEEAHLSMQFIKRKFPKIQFSLINNDAFYYEIPDDLTTLFLFNPFDHVIMSGVVQNILKSLRNNPRRFYILYANPVCADLFLQAGFREIFHVQKMEYLEAVVLEKQL